MKTNIFVRKAAVASLLLAQTIACAWSSSHDVEEGPFANTLPEIQTTVCRQLDVQDLLNLGGVSKALNAASNAPEVWRDRVVGVETKADVINARSVVSYTSNDSKSIEISGDDVMWLVKTGKLVVDGITYGCVTNPDESETYKNILLSFLKDCRNPVSGQEFVLNLGKNGKVELSEFNDPYNTRIVFQSQEDTHPLLLKKPKTVDLAPDNKAKVKWVHDLLLTLDENYTDSGFKHFWGIHKSFDYLQTVANFMSRLWDTAPDTEEEIVAFLNTKYTQFNAEHPEDADAATYLAFLKQKGIWED